MENWETKLLRGSKHFWGDLMLILWKPKGIRTPCPPLDPRMQNVLKIQCFSSLKSDSSILLLHSQKTYAILYLCINAHFINLQWLLHILNDSI